MTILNENNKKIYTGTGTSVFAYDFQINDDDEILVEEITISSGVSRTLTKTSDYTVDGVGDSGGGNVTLTASAFPSGLTALYKLVITRNVPFTQTTDYVENDPFPAETHEAALDRLVMMIQQLSGILDRAILQGPDATGTITFPSPDANKLIGWDSTGTFLENKENSDTNIEDAEDAADAAAASAAAALVSELAAAASAVAAAASAAAASSSADDAAAAAASVDLPALSGASDARKILKANSSGDSFELFDGETLQDIDGDTKIQVEESSDEDIIRFDTGGTQRMVLDANGIQFASGVAINSFLDEDNMASNSASAVPTQQSVKAYVDSSMSSNSQVFTSSGSFTAPTGVSMVFLTMCGGGGGGGGKNNSQNAGSGGGGGESIIRRAYPVVAGNSYTVTIGSGGGGGTGGNPSGTQPTAGGDTIFNDGETDGTAELVASGGGEGETPVGTTATGGSGASAASLTGVDGGSGSQGGSGYSLAGGDGGDSVSTGDGGGGGGSAFGQGGDGGSNDNGSDGIGYGSGGGAGGHTTAGSLRDGGDGAPGVCIVEYFT